MPCNDPANFRAIGATLAHLFLTKFLPQACRKPKQQIVKTVASMCIMMLDHRRTLRPRSSPASPYPPSPLSRRCSSLLPSTLFYCMAVHLLRCIIRVLDILRINRLDGLINSTEPFFVAPYSSTGTRSDHVRGLAQSIFSGEPRNFVQRSLFLEFLSLFERSANQLETNR